MRVQIPGELWAQAWAALPDGVGVVDADLTLVYINAAGAAVTQRPAAELIGRPLRAILPRLVRDLFESCIRQARDTGEQVVWESPAQDRGWYENRAFLVGEHVVVLIRAIEDRRREVERREALLTRTRMLLTLSEELFRTGTVDDIVATVIRLANVHLGADYAGISLLDVEHDCVRTIAAGQIDIGVEQTWQVLPLSHPGPVPQVSRTGVPVFCETFDELTAQFPGARFRYEMAGLRAGATVPLRVAAGVLGALSVAWGSDHAMDEEERATIGALAGYTAQALERAQLQAERVSVAETLQRAMLTQLPQPDHLQLAARYVPATTGAQVGGDWYDAILTADGSTMLVIGDVSGHDMRAAAAMGQMRGAVRAFAYAFQGSPAAILSRLDRAIPGLQLDVVATAVLGRIEQPEHLRERGLRQLRWTNAGHPPPLLLLPDGEVEVLESSPELLLGLGPLAGRSDHVHLLPAGSTLLLYTDGLIEHRGSDLETGVAHLRDVLHDLAGHDVEDLLDEVIDRLVEGRGEDDVALLAVRFSSEFGPEFDAEEVPPEAHGGCGAGRDL